MPVILICDGNPASLDELTQIVATENDQVEATTKACEALQILLSRPITALILGSSLHGIDTPELLPVVKQIDPALPVIAVGETSSLETERQVRTNQLFYYLVRPIDSAELLAAVHQAVLKRSRQPSPVRTGFLPRSDHSSSAPQ